MPIEIAAEARVLAMAFAEAGKEIAGACDDGALRRWDTETGKLLRALPWTAGESTAAFSFDLRAIASAGPQTMIRVWDIETSRLEGVLGRQGVVQPSHADGHTYRRRGSGQRAGDHASCHIAFVGMHVGATPELRQQDRSPQLIPITAFHGARFP